MRAALGEVSGLRFGIAVTTFNRKTLVAALVRRIREFTAGAYDLVVCDDGSVDGTSEALRSMDVVVIGGANKGIAWNKNRGIYYLLHVARCDVVLLLDDDIAPIEAGWEREWIQAAWRYGHVNYALPAFRSSLVAGNLTSEEPGLTSTIPGCALGFSRMALAQVGYFDLRFGRYGHEHSEISFRAVRAGFGGVSISGAARKDTYFYVIGGGLQLQESVTTGTPADLAANEKLLWELLKEPVYRHAWTDDVLMAEFLAEVIPPEQAPLALRVGANRFGSLEQYQDAAGLAALDVGELGSRGAATQSSVSEHPPGKWAAADAGKALTGRIDGSRKFHTAMQVEPWWQVDLREAAVISEVRIYNTTEAVVRDRFKRFVILVGFDEDSWVEVFRKEDEELVGGGADPFVWRPALTAWGRLVRICALGECFLHLDHVSVYGRRGI